MSDNATYDPLISPLDVSGVDYRLIDHESEGTTEIVSALRGHPSVQAAKCLVLIVKVDRRTTRYVLAVVPGDRRVDLRAVHSLYNARYAGFCDADTAQQLAQTVPGTVLPLPSTRNWNSSPTPTSSRSRSCTSTPPASTSRLSCPEPTTSRSPDHSWNA
jgi:Aminoacyl-tRNA editing domain